MREIIFPPVDEATEDGIVAVGGDLEADTLEAAYRSGIFPWPISVEYPLAWFAPDPRGVLDFDELHVSRSFEKFLRKNPYKVTFNQAFIEVITNCARMPRKDQKDTWITPEIIQGYEHFFNLGKAYSVEVWEGNDLIGGMYGVVLGDFLSGESMFMKKDNASKLALFSLIMKIQDQGINWLDTQMVTNVVEQFGGKYIPRYEFMRRIRKMNWEKPRSALFDF